MGQTNLTGCRIIIKYDNSGVVIADADIVIHDADKDIVYLLDDDVVILDENERCSGFIIGPEGPFECMLSIMDKPEETTKYVAFSLFKKVQVEHRKSARYQVMIPGIVKKVEYKDTGNLKTKNQFLVTILNMSGTGFLVKGPKMQFDVGDIIEVQTTQQKTNLLFRAKIVRIQNGTNLHEEVAGKFLMTKKLD